MIPKLTIPDPDHLTTAENANLSPIERALKNQQIANDRISSGSGHPIGRLQNGIGAVDADTIRANAEKSKWGAPPRAECTSDDVPTRPPRFATTEDNAYLKAIFSQPGYVPDGCTPFDPARFTEHENSFALIVDGGALAFPALEQYAYGVQLCLSPECSSAQALKVIGEAQELVFLATDAEVIWASYPSCYPQVGMLAIQFGFRPIFERAGLWSLDGQMHGLQFMRLDIDEWIWSRATDGANAIRDSYAKAAYGMLAHGLHQKADRIFHRFARACAYDALPLLLDLSQSIQ